MVDLGIALHATAVHTTTFIRESQRQATDCLIARAILRNSAAAGSYPAGLRDFFIAAFLYFDPIINHQVRVRFGTDDFDLQIEPSQVADGKPIVSWNSLVLIEVLPPNY